VTRTEVEKKIASRLVHDILASGSDISVWEGGDYAIKNSTNKEEVMAALGSTGIDYLYMSYGSILLVWGNGNELISDSSANQLTDNVLVGAENLAKTLEWNVNA
jgi:hypothetical protein